MLARLAAKTKCVLDSMNQVKGRYGLLTSLLGCLFSMQVWALQPEDVLGEYWKDPLFGSAAAGHTVQVEVLYKLLWPKEAIVPAYTNVRFVVTNKSDQLHLLAFAENPEDLLADEIFAVSMAEDVYHANMEPIVDGQHSHAGSSVDDPKPIVMTLDRKPSVVVRPHEFKEVILQFEPGQELYLFCTLDDHLHDGYISVIRVEDAPDEPAILLE